MRVLSLDTSAEFCTLVLSEGGTVIARHVVEAGRGQAAILAPLPDEILKEKSLKVADLNRLAICTGPGSFTGIRVGLAFARGLSLAASKPLFGFDHFALTHHALKRLGKIADEPILIIRDSKRAELFACLIEAGKNSGAMFLATPEQLSEKLEARSELLFTGNGASFLPEKFSARRIDLPQEEAAISAALLASQIKEIPAAPPEPLYLRDADVTFPKSAQA